jgi:hypothetical protein
LHLNRHAWYFYGLTLKLPAALPGVTEDAKKRAPAEAFMKPVTVDVEIPSRLIDNHFLDIRFQFTITSTLS